MTMESDPRLVRDARAADGSEGAASHQPPAVGQPDEALAFIIFSAIRGVGHKTLEYIAATGLRFADVLATGPTETLPFLKRRAGADDGRPGPTWPQIRAEAGERALPMIEQLRAGRINLIFRGDPRFPRALMDLDDPPYWLFVQGAIEPLHLPSVAIVGTRKPTDDGLFLARYVGACLEDWQSPTVSGLATGIDQLAHESSIRAGVPTIAVLGTGILDNYPKGSPAVREQILKAGGTIISEWLPRANYSAENFIQRNRLQAALGSVLIPVEWARRSGTAHTVRFATALRRPIACLRLPDWPTARVVLEPGQGHESGELFTLPREQEAFDRFVRYALLPPLADFAGQLSLPLPQEE